jgi:hypothetical protein
MGITLVLVSCSSMNRLDGEKATRHEPPCRCSLFGDFDAVEARVGRPGRRDYQEEAPESPRHHARHAERFARGKKSFILRDPVNGFIRKSYVVNKHSDPTLRCKCVVYGGVGRGGTKERDDDRQANAREEDWTGVCLRRRAESRRDSRS